MSEDMINEMYLIAIKSKLQRGTIPLDEKIKCITDELNSSDKQVPVSFDNVIMSQQPRSTITSNNVQTQTIEYNEPKNEVSVPVIEVKYGHMPDEEGFDNRDLNSYQDNLYYKLEINMSTKEAEFNLITEYRVAEEYKQTPGIAPPYAVKFENQPSEGVKLQIVEKGLLKKVKRYWEIVKPCRMKWV